MSLFIKKRLVVLLCLSFIIANVAIKPTCQAITMLKKVALITLFLSPEANIANALIKTEASSPSSLSLELPENLHPENELINIYDASDRSDTIKNQITAFIPTLIEPPLHLTFWLIDRKWAVLSILGLGTCFIIKKRRAEKLKIRQFLYEGNVYAAKNRGAYLCCNRLSDATFSKITSEVREKELASLGYVIDKLSDLEKQRPDRPHQEIPLERLNKWITWLKDDNQLKEDGQMQDALLDKLKEKEGVAFKQGGTVAENEVLVTGKKKCCLLCFIISIILLTELSFSTGLNKASIYDANRSKAIDVVINNQTMAIVIKTAIWDKKRVYNANLLCKYFRHNALPCYITPGFRGDKFNSTYKAQFIDQNYLSPSFPLWHRNGKIGAAIAAVNAWKKGYELTLDKKSIRYILILEDDAETVNTANFLDSLKYSITQVNKINNKWGIIQLDQAARRRRIKKKLLWIDIWPIRGIVYKRLYGFSVTKGLLYTREAIAVVYDNFPVTDVDDIWIGTFIRRGQLAVYVIIPPLIQEGNYTSQISLNNQD